MTYKKPVGDGRTQPHIFFKNPCVPWGWKPLGWQHRRGVWLWRSSWLTWPVGAQCATWLPRSSCCRGRQSSTGRATSCRWRQAPPWQAEHSCFMVESHVTETTCRVSTHKILDAIMFWLDSFRITITPNIFRKIVCLGDRKKKKRKSEGSGKSNGKKKAKPGPCYALLTSSL